MDATKCRIGGTEKNLWNCFGSDVYIMEFKDADDEGFSYCLFANNGGRVCQIHAEVPGYDQAFLWTDPEYIKAYEDECFDRQVDPKIAWDDVRYTIVDDINVMLAYLADIGDTYYDNLPIAGEDKPFVMDMPGTAGSAKVTFAQEENVSKQNFKIEFYVKYQFDVEAGDVQSALEKAEHFYRTMGHTWGDNANEVSWEDTEVVRKSVTMDITS